MESSFVKSEMHQLNDTTALYHSYDVQSCGSKYLVSQLEGVGTFHKISDEEVEFHIYTAILNMALGIDRLLVQRIDYKIFAL